MSDSEQARTTHQVALRRPGVINLAAVLGTVFLRIAGAQPNHSAPVPVENTELLPGSTPLEHPEDAVQRAERILGGIIRTSARNVATLTPVHEDNTPYLAPRVTGLILWNVVVQDYKLTLPSAPSGLSNPNVTTVDVRLDPADGRIYRIRSRWPGGVPPIAPEPAAAAASEQMRRSGNEIYHGFPKDPPHVSLVGALDTVFRGGGDVLTARQISADYVTWSRIGRWQEPRVVWAITLHGIPPVKPPPGASNSPIHSFRYIVDATTGTLLCGSNTPRTEQPPAQE